MIFNIASASLVCLGYDQNATTAVVTYTEYALSLTELILLCVNIFGIIILVQKGAPIILSLTLSTIQCFNIAYSAYVIEYYNEHPAVTQFLYNMALSIITLNCFSLCCVGHRISIHKK